MSGYGLDDHAVTCKKEREIWLPYPDKGRDPISFLLSGVRATAACSSSPASAELHNTSMPRALLRMPYNEDNFSFTRRIRLCENGGCPWLTSILVLLSGYRRFGEVYHLRL